MKNINPNIFPSFTLEQINNKSLYQFNRFLEQRFEWEEKHKKAIDKALTNTLSPVYINSSGGDFHVKDELLYIINQFPDKITLIAIKIYSAAFYLFFEANVQKVISSNANGIYHLATHGLRIRDNGDIVLRDNSTMPLKKYLQYNLEERIVDATNFGLNNNEVNKIKKGQDVYLNVNRLNELLKYSNSKKILNSNNLYSQTLEEIIHLYNNLQSKFNWKELKNNILESFNEYTLNGHINTSSNNFYAPVKIPYWTYSWPTHLYLMLENNLKPNTLNQYIEEERKYLILGITNLKKPLMLNTKIHNIRDNAISTIEMFYMLENYDHSKAFSRNIMEDLKEFPTDF